MPVVTNAELASAVQQVVSRVDAREDQLTAWQAGTPEGGPFADGTYAITNLLGETSYFKSPARLQYEVGLLTTAGTGAVATAEAARDAAEAALASAVVQATNASSSASTASTKASEAQVFRNEAANSEANALAHRNAASASASAAALSEADAEAAAIAAAASAASADADATAAAASAAAAATFDPVNFYTKTQADTLLAAKLATADFSWNNLAGKPATFTPSAHTHAIADVTGLQTALDGKQAAGSYAAAAHGHSIADVTGLQAALDGKQAAGSYAAASHTHVISDVTGLQTALDGKQPVGSYLTGITGTMVTTALGYTPYNSSNPAGYISGITSGMVTTALGYTPASKSGDTFSGAITVNSGSHQAVIAADGAIELTRSGGGAYIDFKDVTGEDFDSRIQQSGAGFALTGTVSAGSDFRSPIFYDSGNTGFYVDPTNDSVLNTAYFRNSAGYNVLLGNASYFGYSSAYRTLLLGNQAYTTVCIGVDPVSNPSGSFNGAGSGVEVMFKNGVSFITPNSADNGYHQVVQLSDGNAYFGNIGQAAGSLRAPIFYDTNNTAYYADPAATSYFAGLSVAGEISGSVSGFARYIPTAYVGGQQLNPQTYFNSDIGLKAAMTAVAGYWADTLWINGYSGLDVPSMCALHTSRQGTPRMWISSQASNATAYGTLYEFPALGYNSGNGSGLYAGTFYDSNNTAYYVDAAGNSVFNSFNVGGGEVYFYGSATNAVSIRTGAGGAYRYFTFDASGNFYALNGSVYGYAFYDQDNTGYYLNPNSSSNLYSATIASQLVVNGDARAPIFYDYDNTGYYTDPASTSVMSDAVIGGRTMSTAMFYAGFTLDANTMPSNSTGFTYSVNAPFTGPVMRASAGGGYDLWLNSPYGGGAALSFRTRNGDTGTFNPWYRLATYDSNPGAGNLYAAIYYDPSNTGYYTRPAGSSYIYELTAANTIYSNGWFRSYGDTGWYSQTYAGGIYMIDTTWVRVYNGKAFFVSNEIAATGNITAYYSDERLKTKTGAIDNALDKVSSLEGFLYVENDLARSLGYSNKKQQVGVSAQAVKAVLPEAVSLAPVDFETLEDGTIVSKSGEEYLTVDYSRIVPLLIEAIKELRAEVEALKNK